jgi:SNF2 family DNA or RNA helicase
MDIDGVTYLIYEKICGKDYAYSSEKTIHITIRNIFTLDYDFYEGDEAIEKFGCLKDKFSKEKFDMELYNFYLFYKNDIKVFIVGVNNRKLYTYVLAGIPIPNLKFLIDCCTYHILYSKYSNGIDVFSTSGGVSNKYKNKSEEIINVVSQPNSSTTDPIIEEPQYANKPMFEYQKRSVKWMLLREEELNEIYYDKVEEICFDDVIFNSNKKLFYITDTRKKVISRGGALIDEVGLGKTYQMLVLSLNNQARDISYVRKGINKLCSKATLVICPNHLCCQWYREIQTMINENYKIEIVKLFTKTHYDEVTYQDLLDADFVILSYSFLGNRSFLSWLSKISSQKTYHNSSIYAEEEVRKIINELSITAKSDFTYLTKTNPNPLTIYWHRIIIDEFHEIFTQTKYKYMTRFIKLFESSYKWCVTGTPFDKSSDCLVNMFDFITSYKSDVGNNIIFSDNVEGYIKSRFFRRNTKKSIAGEYKLPPLKETVVWLNLSRTEKMMYNAYKANENVDNVLLRQLCCHPKIVEELKNIIDKCKTLEDVEKIMIGHYKKLMDISEKKLKIVQYRLANIERNIKIAELKRQRRWLRRNQEFYKHLHKSQNEKIKILIMYPPKIENPFGTDKIEFDDDDIAINEIEENDEESDYDFIISENNQNEIMKYIGNDLKTERLATLYELNCCKSRCLEKLSEASNDYEGKKKTYVYYNDVIDKIKLAFKRIEDKKKKVESDKDGDSDDDDDDDLETCGICMGSITGNDLGVTKCGHIFCYGCVKPFIQKQNKCPICQQKVTNNDIYMVEKAPDKTEETIEFKNKLELIQLVGTKLANLIFYLKKNDKRTIIFSQWDDLLHKVGDVLNEYGIKNVYCRGNVWLRDRAIREFSDSDNVKVIMLSSEGSASGTNLTKAEQVILLDPVYGSYEYRRNTEWQAIGRAYRLGQTKEVNVVRFIVRDTIEEEIYTANKVEDKKHVETRALNLLEMSDDKLILNEDEIKKLNIKDRKPIVSITEKT